MKTILKLVILILSGALTSCVAIGPDGRPVEQEPLPMAEVADVYEGTGCFAIHRLELYPDGTGLWAACASQDGTNESKVGIAAVTSWKTVSGGRIEGTYRKLTNSDTMEKDERFEGVFLFGQLHLSFPGEKRTGEIVFHFMREVEVNTIRGLLKQTIIKTKKTGPNPSSDETPKSTPQ